VTKAAPVWVVDTNVVVSAALSAGGNCDRILRAAVEGKLHIGWTAPILAEYRQVLLRPKFGFSPQLISSLLAIFSPGDQVSPRSCPPLPDPDDEIFLAAALMTPDQVLITGNAAHFPAEICAPVQVLLPVEALKLIA
jgi:uncharacterized protein